MLIHLPDDSYQQFTFAEIVPATSISGPQINFYDAAGSVLTAFTCATSVEQASVMSQIQNAIKENFIGIIEAYGDPASRVPVVNAITPATCVGTNPSIVVIYGNYFLPDGVFTIGGSQVTKITWCSRYLVSAVAPIHAAGVVDIVYTGSNGVATKVGGFTYT